MDVIKNVKMGPKRISSKIYLPTQVKWSGHSHEQCPSSSILGYMNVLDFRSFFAYIFRLGNGGVVHTELFTPDPDLTSETKNKNLLINSIFLRAC